jgi:hypothetical protein
MSEVALNQHSRPPRGRNRRSASSLTPKPRDFFTTNLNHQPTINHQSSIINHELQSFSKAITCVTAHTNNSHHSAKAFDFAIRVKQCHHTNQQIINSDRKRLPLHHASHTATANQNTLTLYVT